MLAGLMVDLMVAVYIYILHSDQLIHYKAVEATIATNNNRDVKVRFDWPLSCNVRIKSSYINFEGRQGRLS